MIFMEVNPWKYKILRNFLSLSTKALKSGVVILGFTSMMLIVIELKLPEI